jgi:ribosome biogenesis GTPase
MRNHRRKKICTLKHYKKFMRWENEKMINLKEYGYRGDKVPPDGLKPGRITAVRRERYELIGAGGPLFGKLKSGVYYSTGEEPFPTVGDFIFYHPTDGGDCQIVKTLPRFSYFARLDPNPNGGKQQAVAANIDVAFIMSSLNRDFNVSRLERYLTLARQSKAKPVIILTKADLNNDYFNEVLVAEAVAGDIPVIPVSVVDGTGLDEVKKHLLPGLTVVFIGMSGVGKSSLLNTLMGDEVMNVSVQSGKMTAGAATPPPTASYSNCPAERWSSTHPVCGRWVCGKRMRD